MLRVNINLSSVEYDRAAGDFKRVWPVVSQLVNAEVGTTPVALSLFRPGAATSAHSSPHFFRCYIRVLFLPSLYSVFFLPYTYVIHRLGGKDLHADVDPEDPVSSSRITLGSCERERRDIELSTSMCAIGCVLCGTKV